MSTAAPAADDSPAELATPALEAAEAAPDAPVDAEDFFGAHEDAESDRGYSEDAESDPGAPEDAEAVPEAVAAALEAAATAAAAPTAAASSPAAGGGAEKTPVAPVAAAAALFGSGAAKTGALSKLVKVGKALVQTQSTYTYWSAASAVSRTATVARFNAEMQVCTPDRFDEVPVADDETVHSLSEQMNKQIPKVIVDPAGQGFFNLFKQMDLDGSGNIAFDEFAAIVRKELRVSQVAMYTYLYKPSLILIKSHQPSPPIISTSPAPEHPLTSLLPSPPMAGGYEH